MSRLILIAERKNKFKGYYFKYELIQEPTSFKAGFVRETHKSDLKNIPIENAHNFETFYASKIVVGGEVLYFIRYRRIKIILIVTSLINIVITYTIIMVYVF